MKHTELSAKEIAQESLKIAGEICIYTNSDIIVEEIKYHYFRKYLKKMPIYLSGEIKETVPKLKLDDLTPRQIVAELDKYVVGQANAKRAVAVALRNRVRRQKLPPEIARDVLPKNILMIGSTGVGKTEIARRLARLANSPFIKIEASKFNRSRLCRGEMLKV